MAASLCVGSLYLISTSRCDLSVALRRWSMGGCCIACGPFTFHACLVVSRSIGCVELRAVFRFRSCILRRVSFMEKMLRPPIFLGSDMGSFSVLLGLWIARYLLTLFEMMLSHSLSLSSVGRATWVAHVMHGMTWMLIVSAIIAGVSSWLSILLSMRWRPPVSLFHCFSKLREAVKYTPRYLNVSLGPSCVTLSILCVFVLLSHTLRSRRGGGVSFFVLSHMCIVFSVFIWSPWSARKDARASSLAWACSSVLPNRNVSST